MVQLSVYGYPKATCTQRVLILLEELELKYNFKQVDLRKGEQKSEDYLRLQPFGKVPVVEYGEKTLFESRSILRYIARNNRNPMDLLGDVYVDMWLEVESQNFNPPASKIVYEKMFKDKDSEPNQELMKAEAKKLAEVLDVYESRLETQEYIAGDNYSIADISHIPYAYCLLKCGFKDLFKSRPNVYNWLKRIMRRPAVKAVLDGNFGEEYQENQED
ncbi:MAG: glutathione S-transferase family protein [Proteobacteria bacterium]|nr:glutathione S-transferase family protein [Pseudomonadota bacterium]NBP15267.1 glutathione S-transferase family protein [bacterium]